MTQPPATVGDTFDKALARLNDSIEMCEKYGFSEPISSGPDEVERAGTLLIRDIRAVLALRTADVQRAWEGRMLTRPGVKELDGTTLANMRTAFGEAFKIAAPSERAESQMPAAWIEQHKGGDNLVWDYPGEKSIPLYRALPSATERTSWISVKDRLPEVHEEVLLYHCIGDSRAGDHAVDVAWRSTNDEGGTVWGFPWDRAAKNPAPRWAIAWMPIEKPEGL